MDQIIIADAAWAAGFIDGEGCLSIRKTNDNAWNITIDVYNCDGNCILKLHDLFGGSLTHVEKGGNRRDQYHWRVANKTAELVLRVILPYLIVKRSHAEVLLEFRKLVNSNSSKNLTVENKSARESLISLIRILNIRGKQAS